MKHAVLNKQKYPNLSDPDCTCYGTWKKSFSSSVRNKQPLTLSMLIIKAQNVHINNSRQV